jgi:hypothetical protein
MALLAGARLLGRTDLLEAARRGGTWLVHAQGADPHAGWAQQYTEDGRPAPGRRFEPAGYASWESRVMVDALLQVTAATGDRSFLRARRAGAGVVGRRGDSAGLLGTPVRSRDRQAALHRTRQSPRRHTG